jgi:restriction endonuclease Mrr
MGSKGMSRYAALTTRSRGKRRKRRAPELKRVCRAWKATKGIFITTFRFTEDARSCASQIGSKIVLINGEQLSHLMVDHDVGVSTVSLYPVKKIDTDYFDESI